MRYHGIFRFLGYALVGIWALLTVHIGYRYISFVSYDTNTKTGTFVEGINENSTVSYLPYTSFTEANRFYQTFLFDSCLDYYFDGEGKLIYNEDLCTVTSDDEKTYTITINSGSQWSNKEPVTLDDVYFSYRYLLVDNVWERQSLRVFNDVSVSQNEDSISVTFPESSPDNRVLFTHFILPSSLGQVTFDQYVEKFLRSPIWSDCATIYPQMGDDSNLVFDLSNCDNTYLLRYQLQLLASSTDDPNDVDALDGLSSDFYDLISRGSPDFDGFDTKDFTHMRVPLRKYVMLFFNTQSDKLSAKIQRALGGYVFNNFYDDEAYKNFLRRDHLGFDVFLSTGGSVEKYLIAKNPSISLDKYDLEKINIDELPQKLQLSSDETEVYFLEEVRGYKTVEITLPSVVGKIRVIHNDGEPYTPKTYESGQGRFFYSLSVYNDNLDEGRNTYVVQTLENDTWSDIASFEVYYLASPLAGEDDAIDEADKIQVVYFIDETSLNVVSQLQAILEDGGLGSYFTWNGFESEAQFLGKLSSLDYDIVVGTVDVGLREDLSALFSSQTPTVNPSLYTQDNFVGLLSEYTTNTSVRDALMSIYSSDVPFVVMGQLFDSSFVRSPLISYLPVEVQGVYHFKRQLYENVSFGAQRGFQWEDVFNKQNFVDFFNHL